VLLNIYEEMQKINYDEKNLECFYEKNIYLYKNIFLVKIQHIFLKNKGSLQINKVKLILKKLKQGKKFKSLAAEYSEDHLTRNNGGNLGWLKQNETGLVFQNHIFKNNIILNEIKIVATKTGLHIIKINDKITGKTRNLADIRGHVETHLTYENAKNKLTSKLKKIKSTVTYNGYNNFLYSKFIFLNKDYYFKNINLSKIFYKRQYILSGKIKSVSFFFDYIDLMYILDKAKISNNTNIGKVRKEITSILNGKKIRYLNKYRLEKIYKKLMQKKSNQILLKKKLLWLGISNIKRKNKKLNIELLQKIFAKTDAKKTFNLFMNTSYVHFIINIKDKSYNNRYYEKYYSIYRNVNQNFI